MDNPDYSTEVWRLIPSLPTYMASSMGRIMKVPYISADVAPVKRQYGGVPTCGVWDKETRRYVAHLDGKNYKIARLVCEAFHGQPQADKTYCLHLDENSANNRPENLMWGTQKENLAATGYRGSIAQRKRQDLRKLTKNDARTIRDRIARGETAAKLAREFSISAGYASRIASGHAHPDA